MKKLTEQSIFNRVVRGLAKQNWLRSYRHVAYDIPYDAADQPSCAYRGADGRKCALGHLLTDAEVEKIGNTQAILAPRHLPERLRVHFTFVKTLQLLHDDRDANPDLRTACENFAKLQHLEWPKDVK